MSPLSRRTILKALGWSATGIAVVAGGGCALPVIPPRNEPTTEDAAAWISLRPEGHFEIYSPRAEMGQGIVAGLRLVAAEELGVGPEQVRAVYPDTALVPLCRATVGSDSMKVYGPLMARAAAALALAIRRQAAARLDADPAAARLGADGVMVEGQPTLPYAALASHPAILVGEDELAAASPQSLTAEGSRQVIGTALPTDGIRAIVTGNGPLYADDIRLPGMLFGSMLRSDGIDGTLAAIDDSACRELPGYAGLVQGDGFAGILAERRGMLTRALAALRMQDNFAADLSSDTLAARIDIDVALAKGTLEHVLTDDGALGADGFDIDLRLDVPLAAHASIEPRTAVARFADGGGLEVWTATQDAFYVRKRLAREFGLSEDEVVVHGMRIGGGFGGRTLVAAELDAARLAKASGRPVKVQWSRRDEFRAGFHRQPSSHRIRAAADAEGRITRWWHAFRAGHVIFTSAAMGPGLQFATSFIADPGTARGALPPYAAGASRVEFEDVRLPVPTGPWRGLGAGPNCWAVETAVDALARRHGFDPVAFRLANMAEGHPRLAAVLRQAAAMAGWDRADKRDDGTALGVACGIYKEMSYAAAVARVAQTDNGPRVTKLWCAQDCGLVVNPDQVRAQIEGNLTWGIGMALYEELTVEDGRILGDSFFDYAMPRYAQVPEMEIALIEGAAEPSGAGETAIVCAAAVTNALAAIDGAPVTRLPAAV